MSDPFDELEKEGAISAAARRLLEWERRATWNGSPLRLSVSMGVIEDALTLARAREEADRK